MPNQITSDGLEIKSVSDIVSDITASMQTIYGSDINVDSNSPDGQLINIFAQASEDLLELLLAVYNTFSVDKSFGVYLDQRVALNGIARRQGTYTETNVTVTTVGSINLVGLDALVADPTAQVFTVSDGTGNQFYLEESVATSNGANVLVFRAKAIGLVETVPNTITNQVTVVQGVTSVNNPAVASSVGVNEETDTELKIRHAKMFFLASTGPSEAIQAALLAIADVTDALVVQNDTDSPVSSIPAYSIWAIVDGGTDAEVGTAIYNKKAPGCGMKGSHTYVVARPNGTSFTAKFDRAISEDLYIAFTFTAITTGLLFDTAAIKESLVETLIYKLNQPATIGDIVIAMHTIEPRGIVSVVGVSSDGMSYVDILHPSDYQHKLVLTAGRIDITIP